MDIYFARRLVLERLPDAREAIPAGFGTPKMGPISTGLGEIYQFEVRGDGHSLMDLRSILEWDIAFQAAIGAWRRRGEFATAAS